MSALLTLRNNKLVSRVLRLLAALPWLLAPAWCGAEAAPADTAWQPIKHNPDTTLQASGDARSDSGAHVIAQARSGASAQVAGAASSLDVQTLRGKRLLLSAELSASADAQGAALWLRADDASGQRVGLANSPHTPAPAGAATAYQVELVVPADAVRVAFGFLFKGQGQVEAQRLRLQVAEATMDTAAMTIAPERLFDAAATHVREQAYYAERIDWDNAVAELRVAASKATSPAQVQAQIRALLALLGDNHSFLIPPAAPSRMSGSAAAPVQAETKLLAGEVGYVRIPAFASTEAQAQTQFARTVEADIAAHAAAARKGWIVDLRGNSGGNMWPMLAALRALLGEGVVGAARDRREQLRDWRAGDHVAGLAAGASPDLSAVPVAVLLDGRTASSGEAVAVAFHGRARSRSFGSATAGQSSANAVFALPDGSRLALTVALNLDRHGELLSPRLEPDQATAAGDATLAAALAWLTAEQAAAAR